MARPPRSQRPHIKKPSPLQQVHLTRPISTVSQNPEMGLVRDPNFWKRFSVAVHQAEDIELGEKGDGRGKRSNSGASGTSSLGPKYNDEWLLQQRKEKRNCRILCASITLLVALVIIAAAVVGWYFTKRKS